MSNKPYALEWLTFARKHLNTAKLLYDVKHYEDIILLRIATNYYKEDRYPNPNYSLPTRDEIKKVLEFTEDLFEKACNNLNIELSEIKC